MTKNFLIAGTFFAGIAVVLGAFGAHALKEKLAAPQLTTFETGVRYQFYHAIALMLIYLLSGKIDSKLLSYAGIGFTLGIILFSGSLYLLSTSELLGIEKWKSILGPVTPLGGLCFITGWIMLVIAALRVQS